MKHLIEFILKRSWLVIIGFLIVTVLVMSGTTRAKISTTASVIQPDHHPLLTISDEIKKTFGSVENVIAVLGGDIYTAPRIIELRKLTTQLESVYGVAKVTSLANFSKLEQDDGFIKTSKLFKNDTPTALELAAARAYINQESARLVTKDGQNTIIIVEMKTGADQQKFGTEVGKTINAAWAGEKAIAGAPYIIAEVNRTLVNDIQVVGLVALGLILLFLFLNFRSIHGVILPLIQVVLGLVWSMGLYGWSAGTFGSLTAIGIIAVLAVGSSFSLHLLGRFYAELAKSKNKTDALRATFSETAQGVVISAIAIIASMMTLWLSDISTLRDLGTLIIFGIIGALAGAMTLLPALVNILPQPKVRVNPERPGAITGLLTALARFVNAHRVIMMIAAGGLIIFGLIGALRIKPNTSYISFFPKNSQTVKNIAKVDKLFGGTSSIGVLIEGDILEPKILNAIQTFSTRAKSEIAGVTNTISLADTIITLNNLFTGKREIPVSREKVAQELLIYQSSADTTAITQQLSLNQQQTVVQVGVPLGDTFSTRIYYNQIKALSEDVFKDIATVKVGGQGLSGLALEDAMIRDFIISLSLAIVLVIIIDSFVRSFKAAIVTISSLIMTVVLQYGLLGWLGIDLNISTMLLGALAIGVGDYAIHLTVRFLEERRLGKTPEEALETTIITSGRSILFTALTLGAGFAALSFSQLQPVSSLGQMMVFTVLAVGISSLTLLPAMCLQFLRDPNKKPILASSAAD